MIMEQCLAKKVSGESNPFLMDKRGKKWNYKKHPQTYFLQLCHPQFIRYIKKPNNFETMVEADI